MESVADALEDFGGFTCYFPRRPGYADHFGLWLNRQRVQHRRSGAVAYGIGVALGGIRPGIDYYRALTDGEGQAKLLKAQTEAMTANRKGD